MCVHCGAILLYESLVGIVSSILSFTLSGMLESGAISFLKVLFGLYVAYVGMVIRVVLLQHKMFSSLIDPQSKTILD